MSISFWDLHALLCWMLGWALAVWIVRKRTRGNVAFDGLSATSPWCITYRQAVRSRVSWNHGILSACLRVFYALGGVCGTLGLAVSIIVLAINLATNVKNIFIHFQGTASATSQSSSRPPPVNEATIVQSSTLSISEVGHLTPLLPGVNIPFGYIWYLLFAASISLVVHEAGHAFAAHVEGVR
jgi:hypothetical protein